MVYNQREVVRDLLAEVKKIAPMLKQKWNPDDVPDVLRRQKFLIGIDAADLGVVLPFRSSAGRIEIALDNLSLDPEPGAEIATVKTKHLCIVNHLLDGFIFTRQRTTREWIIADMDVDIASKTRIIEIDGGPLVIAASTLIMPTIMKYLRFIPADRVKEIINQCPHQPPAAVAKELLALRLKKAAEMEAHHH